MISHLGNLQEAGKSKQTIIQGCNQQVLLKLTRISKSNTVNVIPYHNFR